MSLFTLMTLVEDGLCFDLVHHTLGHHQVWVHTVIVQCLSAQLRCLTIKMVVMYLRLDCYMVPLVLI